MIVDLQKLILFHGYTAIVELYHAYHWGPLFISMTGPERARYQQVGKRNEFTRGDFCLICENCVKLPHISSWQVSQLTYYSTEEHFYICDVENRITIQCGSIRVCGPYDEELYFTQRKWPKPICIAKGSSILDVSSGEEVLRIHKLE